MEIKSTVGRILIVGFLAYLGVSSLCFIGRLHYAKNISELVAGSLSCPMFLTDALWESFGPSQQLMDSIIPPATPKVTFFCYDTVNDLFLCVYENNQTRWLHPDALSARGVLTIPLHPICGESYTTLMNKMLNVYNTTCPKDDAFDAGEQCSYHEYVNGHRTY